MTNESIIQNTSYTNKDFNSIYVELLDLVKKLTYKWDPSISNESDPGVILLKLNALIADKNNYNIDKNVLECFPSSVTQEGNARELFEQLGYSMKGTISAITAVALKWTGDQVKNGLITIPMFSMVTDANTEYVYTLLGSIDPSLFSSLNPSSNLTDYIGDIKLPKDGTTITVLAMQGVANDYDIEGKTLITLQDLDSENRLYFNGYNIANNGIFIQNADTRDSTRKLKNFSDWKLVNNLASQSITDKVFKYGVLKNSTTSFIEFSDNISDVIDNGIYITFLSSSGSYGNIPVNMLNNFYSTVSAIDTTTDPTTNETTTSTIQLSTSTISVSNAFAGIGGTEPESINSAYRNYTKVAGTFDTLVTLRDYINKIQTSNLVSNVIVTDRTCDLQDTVKIVQPKVTGIEAPFVEVLSNANAPLMNAFDLKLYLTQYVSSINSYADFSRSFDLIEPSSQVYTIVKSYIENTKCIQHDYKDIREYANKDDINNSPCIFLNEFPLNIRIIPQYELTDIQKAELKSNIVGALYNNLNASKVEFGQEASYDSIYDIVLNSDERIKTVILDDILYETYAIILNENGTFEKILVSSLDKNAEDTSKSLRTDIYAKSVLSGSSSVFLPNNDFPFGLNQNYDVLQNNIEKLDADTDIIVTLSGSKAEDGSDKFTGSTRQNEVLEFTSPKLTQLVKYSQYVRYGAVGVFHATGTYTLQGTSARIAFFWKASGSGYNYEVIDSGSIIETNIVINDGPTEEVKDLIKKLPVGKGKIDTTEDIQIVDSIPASYILSEDNYISTQIVSSLLIGGNNQPTSNLYWVTDDPDPDYYTLFEAGDTVRTLHEGEYFIYSNSAKTVYTIYGANTKITRTTKTTFPKWAVKRISLDKILTGGIEAFDDSDWFILDGTNYTVTTEEVTKQSIPSNTSITVETRAGFNIPSKIENIHFTYDRVYSSDVNLYSTGTYLASYGDVTLFDTFDITGQYNIVPGTLKVTIGTDSYTDIVTDENSGKIVSKTGEQIGTVYYTNSILSSPDGLDYVIRNGSFILNGDKTGSGVKASIDVDIPLFQLSISYSDDNIEIVNFYASEKEKTISSAILVVDMSSENSMSLLDRQVLTAHYVDSEGIKQVREISTSEGKSPLFIYSSYLLQSSIGHGINTTEIYYTGDKRYLTLYTFSASTVEGDITFDSNSSNFYLKCSKGTSTAKIIYNLPIDRKYIMKYYIPNNVVTSLIITNSKGDSSRPIYSINGEHDLLNDEGVHYVLLNMPDGVDTGPFTIQFDVKVDSKASADATIIIYPLFSYTERETRKGVEGEDIYQEVNGVKYEKLPVDINFADIVARMSKLDTYGKFDYTYIPASDIYIDNPLAAESFNYLNHYANKFTICKLKRMNQDNIIISNRTK